jgi:hypothetical protein
MVPQNWNSLFHDEEWDAFATTQLDYAHYLLPMRLDKCLLTALALYACCNNERGNAAIDVFDIVEILPSWFKLDNFDKSIRDTLYSNGLALDLKVHLGHRFQDDFHVIDQVAEGYPVTDDTADGIIQFLNERGLAASAVINKRAIDNRTDNGANMKKKKPCQSQTNRPRREGLPIVAFPSKRARLRRSDGF